MAKIKEIIRALPATFAGLCATLAFATAPIPGAEAWSLERDQFGCWAERDGDVHVKIVVNEVGSPDLFVSRPDWQTHDAPIDFGLQIDGGPAARFHGTGIANRVLVAFEDTRERALLRATSLDWHMPWGHYHSDVRGIGIAFVAVAACEKGRKP